LEYHIELSITLVVTVVSKTAKAPLESYARGTNLFTSDALKSEGLSIVFKG